MIKNVPVVGTPVAALPPITQTQAPAPPPANPLANPQIASLIPALLEAQQANLLSQQQKQEQALLAQQQQIADLLAKQQEEDLLVKQFAEEIDPLLFADSLTEEQQEALNEQILANINLDDFTDEELENLDIDTVVDALTNSQSTQSNSLVFPKKNLFASSNIRPESPKSSVVTIFKSGSTPGDFTRVFSTIYFDEDNSRRKRDTLENDIHPSKPIFVTKTETVEDLEAGQYILGSARGPVSADIYDILDPIIESGIITSETASTHPVIPTLSLDFVSSQKP